MTGAPQDVLLSVQDLVVEFQRRRSVTDIIARRSVAKARAVDGVSLDIRAHETIGLVGESGSGKTTLGRAILGLYQPVAGRVLFRGRDIADPDPTAQQGLRRSLQMVFQNPLSSLNLRYTVAQTIGEALRFHRVVPDPEVPTEIDRLLRLLGLAPEMAHRAPRQLSGGQCQRVGLARALAVRPSLLVLDEPVAALDVSIQAQVLNLLRDLRDELGLTMLFVAHELGVVRYMSNRVAVMYLGRIMEIGRAEEIFGKSRHPYAQSLLKAVPRLEPVKRHRRPVLQGDVPSPLAIPSGCRFRTRCPLAVARCAEEAPAAQLLSPTHRSLCHFSTP